MYDELRKEQCYIPKAIEYLLTEKRDILEKTLKSLPKRLEELRKCNGGVISY